jgi:hypothetical protein
LFAAYCWATAAFQTLACDQPKSSRRFEFAARADEDWPSYVRIVLGKLAQEVGYEL